MFEKLVPYLERAGGVDGCQGCQEVVLGSLNCWFGRIHLMVVWLYELDAGVIALNEVFYSLGVFIVEDVELGGRILRP